MEYTENYIKVRNILLIVLILNFAVAGAKIIYGMMINASSMTADGYHSLSDGTSNIVGIIGIWIASKPPDENHPYGHHKFETLATVVIGILLFFIAFTILQGAYDRFKNPVTPSIDIPSFIVMIVTLIINIFVSRYETKKGKELKSSILLSDAKNTSSDIYVSLSVIAGLIASKLNYPMGDTLIAAVIAILIIKAGLEVLIPSINVLSDAAMADQNEIHDYVITFQKVIYCHKIRTRGKENHVLLDFHLGIEKRVSLEEAHFIAHEIKDKIIEKFDEIQEVIIHIEPGENNS